MGRVGTASRHSYLEVGLSALDQPRSPNGERKVGAWLRRALVCEEGTTTSCPYPRPPFGGQGGRDVIASHPHDRGRPRMVGPTLRNNPLSS